MRHGNESCSVKKTKKSKMRTSLLKISLLPTRELIFAHLFCIFIPHFPSSSLIILLHYRPSLHAPSYRTRAHTHSPIYTYHTRAHSSSPHSTNIYTHDTSFYFQTHEPFAIYPLVSALNFFYTHIFTLSRTFPRLLPPNYHHSLHLTCLFHSVVI